MDEDLTPRQLAKRDQIASAARRLFLSNGFANTSMDSVTAEAGVSKQTLYTYFPAKTDLMAHVLVQSLGQLALKPPAPGSIRTLADLRTALIEFSTSLTDTLMRPESIALVRLVLGEAFRVPDLRQSFREALPGQILGRTAALLRQAADAGLIAFEDANLAARMFVGPVMTYVALDGFLSADPAEPPDHKKLEQLVDAFLATVEAQR